jgi:hypothetical protein
METKNKVILTFSLPEDSLSDTILVHEGLNKDGSFHLATSGEYNYGVTELEFPELDTSRWYKIQFGNEKSGTVGPLSEPVYGGTLAASAPFLAVSSTSDGSNYATSSDLYEYSGLIPADVTPGAVSTALRSARAVIDYRTAEMDLNRFDAFPTSVARRKYNATLRIVKEAEINVALGNIYTNLSDDLIIKSMREGGGAGSVSIGSTSVDGDSLAERPQNIDFLAKLAQRYFDQGERLLSSLDTTSVRLVGYDIYIRSPKFKYPFNGL